MVQKNLPVIPSTSEHLISAPAFNSILQAIGQSVHITADLRPLSCFKIKNIIAINNQNFKAIKYHNNVEEIDHFDAKFNK